MSMTLEALSWVLAVTPPTTRQSLPADAWGYIINSLRWFKWVAAAICVAGIMLLGMLLTIDDRLWDRWGVSIEATAIKTIFGLVLVSTSFTVAGFFV